MNSEANRLFFLDYLRGLSAFGILVYHYLSWTLGNFKSESIIARFGVYGVSIFYILSGITLFHVYHTKLQNPKEFIKNFLKKRLLRILPLLCLAILLSVLVLQSRPDFWNLFLNVTGLFGFFDWNKSIVIGGWSIGNEIVFYAFFILMMLFYTKNKIIFYSISVLSFMLFVFFAFSVLSPNDTLTNQWENYVNPMNQLFLFVSGILIASLFRNTIIKPAYNSIIVLIGLILFCFSPAFGDTINLVTGVNRIVFTLSVILICLFFYKSTFSLPAFLHKPLHFLGLISYSLYLLHPIFFSICGKGIDLWLSNDFPYKQTLRLLLSTGSTVVVSYFVYSYYEVYFISLGKKTRKLIENEPV